MDKALIASDAVMSFFIELAELNSNAFRKIFEDKPFRKLGYLKNRIEICREVGVPLDEFLSIARESFHRKELLPTNSACRI